MFRGVLQGHGVTHALLVQPSCYGNDNACMLDAMARSGGRYKGIAVIGWDVPDNELYALKQQGMVGVRLHLVRSCPDALSRPEAARFLARIKALDWFVEVYAVRQMWADLAQPLQQSGVKVLIAHLGEPDVRLGIGQPGFQALLRLGREGNAVVKLSAPFRVSAGLFPYDDLDPYAAALIDAFGLDRCVWGSDWPFLDVPKQVEYDDLLRLVKRWLPRPADSERVLWQNPARLFGFAA
jgi:predicted TIM-barrel fold metal-dependent hydrolase